MKILLAWDGSSSSDAVIREAAGRPWPEKTEFLAVTALDPFFFTHAPLLLEEAKKSTLEALEEQAKQLENAGWKSQRQVVLENPRHGLPRVADEWCADLMLVGSHGRGAIGRLLVGSTAQAVLRHAHCSVEVVRDALAERERIQSVVEPGISRAGGRIPLLRAGASGATGQGRRDAGERGSREGIGVTDKGGTRGGRRSDRTQGHASLRNLVCSGRVEGGPYCDGFARPARV